MSDRLSSRICENSPQTNGELLSILDQIQPGVLNLDWSIRNKDRGVLSFVRFMYMYMYKQH